MKDVSILSEDSEQFKKIKESWNQKASEATIDTLSTFLRELVEDYQHDYGTIIHAMSYAAIASINVLNKSKQGGISGFQADAIMWNFIRLWRHSSNKTGMKLVDYDDMLYPHHEHNFKKTIRSSVWTRLQEEAAKKISDADVKYAAYLNDLAQYSIDIAAFVEKYPDYYDNRSYYDHLGLGTSKEWDDYYEKKANGFEFAPRKPYASITRDSSLYHHWQSIVAGVVPFGYTICDD